MAGGGGVPSGRPVGRFEIGLGDLLIEILLTGRRPLPCTLAHLARDPRVDAFPKVAHGPEPGGGRRRRGALPDRGHNVNCIR